MNEENTIASNRTPIRFFFLSCLFWVVWGLFLGLVTYFGRTSLGANVSFGSIVLGSAVGWLFWGLLTPLILWLRSRISITRERMFQTVVIHTIISLVFGVLQRTYYGFFQSLIGQTFTTESFQEHMAWHMEPARILLGASTISLVYWVIIGAGYLYEYYNEAYARKIESAQLEKELVGARLTSLQYQLQPHFLFNTLNTVVALISGKESKRAISVISSLSELLRFSLESVDQHEVTLKSEMALLNKYLEIVSIRFGDRLTIVMEIDAKTLDAFVPNMILQPLVENGVLHGVEKSISGGTVTISSAVMDGRLHLRVSDTGNSVTGSENESLMASSGVRIGLTNTKSRLSALYGREAEISLTSADGGGTTVELVLPYHTGPVG